jgi:hypothetical protein
VTLHDPKLSTVGKAYQRVRSAARMLIRGTGESFLRRFELQRDYLVVQEFLPGNGFDTRITVIGNRAFGFRRFNRPDDFRASGSGRIDWNPAAIDHDSVRLAFKAAQQLRTQSLAVDILRREGNPVLTEIRYYYCREMRSTLSCNGWTGRCGRRIAILEDFLERAEGASVTLRRGTRPACGDIAVMLLQMLTTGPLCQHLLTYTAYRSARPRETLIKYRTVRCVRGGWMQAARIHRVAP